MPVNHRHHFMLEYRRLMAEDEVAAERLRRLLPAGPDAYTVADLEACIQRARAASQVARIPKNDAGVWGPE